MNATTVDPLEEFVCSVVRPIRASEGRKKRMYEELSAHLREACETRIESGDPEAAAVAHALARFGDSSTLRNQLQAEVPRIERILCTRYGGRRDKETELHYVCRWTGYALVFLTLCVASVATVEHFLADDIFSDWRTVWRGLRFVAWMSPFLAAFHFVLFWTDVRRWRHIEAGNMRKAYRSAWLYAGILSAVACAAAGAVLYFEPQLRTHGLWFLAGALAVSAVLAFANLMETRARAKKRPWSQTEIGF